MGDHAGHIVFDDAAGTFLNYTRESGNVLHGLRFLDAQKLTLPSALPIEPTGHWDPHLVRIGSEWYVAFVESPTQGNPWDHHPALVKGSSIENLTLVDANEELRQTEGMVIQKVGGEWYVLCSSGRGEIEFEGVTPAHYRIYDLNMDFVGTLNAPYVTNIPTR